MAGFLLEPFDSFMLEHVSFQMGCSLEETTTPGCWARARTLRKAGSFKSISKSMCRFSFCSCWTVTVSIPLRCAQFRAPLVSTPSGSRLHIRRGCRWTPAGAQPQQLSQLSSSNLLLDGKAAALRGLLIAFWRRFSPNHLVIQTRESCYPDCPPSVSAVIFWRPASQPHHCSVIHSYEQQVAVSFWTPNCILEKRLHFEKLPNIYCYLKEKGLTELFIITSWCHLY